MRALAVLFFLLGVLAIMQRPAENDVETAAHDVLSILKAETLKTFRNKEIKTCFFS